MSLQVSSFQAEGGASRPELRACLPCSRNNTKAPVIGVRWARGEEMGRRSQDKKRAGRARL